MIKSFKVLSFLILFSIFSKASFAWGPEGHAMIARIAMRYLKPGVKQNILKILGSMSVDTAANWMDIVRSNHDYDFMKTWHYADVPRGEEYKETTQENMLNRLNLTYNELLHKKILCDQQIKMDLMILMHLVGDETMPLHAGYDNDLGGNKVTVQYDTAKNLNLHWFWDENIIQFTKIKESDCLRWYDELKQNANEPINFYGWMMDSHSLVDAVYDFKGNILTKEYLQKNKIVVEKQLMKGGLRLANVLNALFEPDAAVLDYNAIVKKYSNGVSLQQAAGIEGSDVTVAGRVIEVKASEKITQLLLTDENGQNELQVAIFARDNEKFPGNPAELFKNKNVLVKGKVKIFKGKPEIVIENASNILILE